MGSTSSSASVARDHPRTRRKYGAQEKVRIVLEGLRGEVNKAELCRKEGLNRNVYYKRRPE